VVTNLIDKVNQTRDDLHMWLTPYTRGSSHMVKMKFPIPYALAMIRIWVCVTQLSYSLTM